ncbi:MAG: DUF4292 domain-containing protein [Bacteroidia bacterium]|nr:DUF4292 domain-containing protein [Bacteroidia bacterium]
MYSVNKTNTWKIALLLIIVGSLSQSCKTKKFLGKNYKKITAQALHDSVKANLFDYEWLSIKGKFSLVKGEGKTTFAFNLRSKKDSVIWASFRLMGIEGARVLITKDSIKVLDRLNQKLYLSDYSYLKKFLPFDASLAILQNMLVGNPVLFDGSNIRMLHDENSIQLMSSNEQFENRLFLDKYFKVTRMLMKHFLLNYNANINFSNFEAIKAVGRIPTNSKYQVNTTQSTGFELNYSKVSANNQLKMPFKVPSKYERVRN